MRSATSQVPLPQSASRALGHPAGRSLGRTFMRWLAGWRRVFFFGALVLVTVLSRTTYDRSGRNAIARQIHITTWQVLPWFTLLTALISLVLIRIVLTTAQSYGLSQFALEMVVRVLVLELIPLVAALFVTLRVALLLYRPVELAPLAQQPNRATQVRAWVPGILATAFSVVTMVAVSNLVALVLAYVGVYGLSPWGLSNYARTVGQVFDVAVTLGFTLKVLFFSLAVAVIPTVAQLDHVATAAQVGAPVQPGTVRLFMALVLIEGLSLSVKYF